jgi:hypothetical protein
MALALLRGDGVDIGRRRREGQPGPPAPGFGDNAFQQVIGAFDAFEGEHRVERIQPLPRFGGIDVDDVVHVRFPCGRATGLKGFPVPAAIGGRFAREGQFKTNPDAPSRGECKS